MTAVCADAKLLVLLQYKHFGSPLQNIRRYDKVTKLLECH